MSTHRRTATLVLALSAALWTAGASAGDVVVSAASSLTNAFQKVAQAYEAEYPETHIVLNFAASDVLLRQIANGAPADVYASADEEAMDKAQSLQILKSDSRANFASNQLVAIVPSSSTLVLSTLDDLKQSAIKRIAYGDPASVPVGRYTRNALEAAHVWNAVSPRGVLAANVRQALDYVARDEVDVGFVYATDAAIFPDRVKIALRVPSTTPIRYPIAVIKTAANPQGAESFEHFVLSPQGQKVLATFGFLKP